MPIFRSWSQSALIVIAIGSGGMRPIVPAFGGDQFTRPQQDELLERFFSMLHYGGTIISFIAIATMPLLRNYQCHGEKFCFSLAFGVQGIFLVLSFSKLKF